MKRFCTKNFITISIAVLFATFLTLVLFFAVPSPVFSARENMEVLDYDGNSFSATSIAALISTSSITQVNYVPNIFVHPAKTSKATVVDLSQKNAEKLASRGTFQFVFLNLDPMAEDYAEQAETLKRYIQGDNSYHFTLCIPAIWSSCTVYLNGTLYKTIGDISNYNTIDYCSYDKKSETHKSTTEPFYLDISFSSRPQSISPDRFEASKIVTIHYESFEAGMVGFDGLPLIGPDDHVRGIGAANRGVLTALSAIVLLTSVSVALLCILKRTLRFLPQLAIGAAVFVWLISELMKMTALSTPSLPTALSAAAIAFALLASLFSLKPQKISACWLIATAVSILHAVMVFVLPLTPISATIFNLYNIILSLLVSAFVLVFLIISALRQSDAPMFLNPLLAVIAAILSVLVQTSSLAFVNPLVYLAAIMIGVLIFISFRVFVSTERRNRALTFNLQSEVVRQTAELQTVVSERDKILSYVSHDMKKNSVSIGRFLATIKEREKDNELAKTIDIVMQKNREMTDEFTELAGFAKYNYLAEASDVFFAKDILTEVFNSIFSDCEANGIVLTLQKVSKIHVWAKANGLKAVLKNIIFNAIEHADCSTITLSASIKNKACCFHVTDNGKGIQTDHDVFAPDISFGGTEQNSGFGLYICNNIVSAMGGKISYTQANGKLTFIVTVPIA